MPRGNFLSTNQKHYQDLGIARHQYGISALVTQTSFNLRGLKWRPREKSAVFSGEQLVWTCPEEKINKKEGHGHGFPVNYYKKIQPKLSMTRF